jgi:hypothetical protein
MNSYNRLQPATGCEKRGRQGIARKMKTRWHPFEEIAEDTGLSLDANHQAIKPVN